MFKKIQLKNGLDVLMIESRKSPVISVQMWVRTGSADEVKSEAGISHFIEHLVFKGTEKFKVGEIASLVEASGGELNAYTSFDQTVFYVTISSSYFDVACDTVSQMMGFPLFDKEEVDAEREVVVEEIKRGQDSPGRRVSQNLFSLAYPKHPYGIPVIGYEKNVRSWSVKKIKQFYSDRYSTKNMFLVVAGDFKTTDAIKKLENYFGKIPTTPLKKVKRPKGMLQTKTQIQVEKAEYKDLRLQMGWKIPSVKHKDIPALDVLALLIGQGDSSRLVKELRIKSQTVNGVGASCYSPMDQGLFGISANLNPENFEKTLETVFHEIEKIKHEKFEANELEKAKLNLESEQFFGLETVDGLTRQYGNLEFYFKDPAYFKKYIDQIKKLKMEDIQKVAKKYLTEKTLSVSILTDQSPVEIKKIFNKNIKFWAKISQAPKIKKIEKKTVEKNKPFEKILPLKWSSKGSLPEIEKINLPGGAKLYLRESKDSPVFSIKSAFLGGLRFEKNEQAGITELFSRSWLTGTQQISEETFSNILEENASFLSAFSGRNTFGLSGGSLSSHQRVVGSLFKDSLLNGAFLKEPFEREKFLMLEQLKTRDESPSQVCLMQFMQGLFGAHPYGRDMLGSNETLKKLKNTDLQNYWNQLGIKNNFNICITGNFEKKWWIDLLTEIAQELPKGKLENPQFNLKLPQKNTTYFKQMNREQTHIAMGFSGLKLHDKERFGLQLIQAVLAGQGGRLFLELRDKNSLAYSVSPIKFEGIDAGYFGAYIGCSPEKSKKAVEMMNAEFQKLMETPIGAVELDRAKKYLIGRHDIDLQKTSSVCASILFDEIYGIDSSKNFKAHEVYEPIKAKELLDLSQKLFSQPKVLSIVGPQDPGL